MPIATMDRPLTAGHRQISTMVSPSTKRIFSLSAQLRHDLEEPERKRLLSDIQELRCALHGLEHELLGQTDRGHGDAS